MFRHYPSTITSMSIDAAMTLENDRFEEESTRVNLGILLAEQQAETLRCQRLRERAVGGPSAMPGAFANVSMRHSVSTLMYDSCCLVFDIRIVSASAPYFKNTPICRGPKEQANAPANLTSDAILELSTFGLVLITRTFKRLPPVT